MRPRHRTKVVRRPNGSGRALLALSDFSWQGYYAVPASGPGTSSGGSPNYGGNVLAIRYVGGQRRYLMPHFTLHTNGRTWGDLVEYADPASALSTSATPTTAPELVETRRWAADWTKFDATPSWANGTNQANGAKLGWTYWDEAQGVLWYTIYGYYSGVNQPFLGAVQLLDTSAGGGYYNVGTKYGPWWYRSSANGDLYWKAVNMFGHYPVPASAQADLGGRKLLIGGSVGASHSAGHWGPGIQAFSDWPSLSDPADTVIAQGLNLADYTTESNPNSPPNTRRNGDYHCLSYADHDLSDTFPEPVGGVGWWNGSLDRVAGWSWVETANKHGIVIFMSRATGRSTYGDNPISRTEMEVTSLTRVGTTATLVMLSAGGATIPFTTGDSVTISNASPAGWNGTYTVTQTNATTFTFTCSGSLTTPATRADVSLPIYASGWNSSVIPDLTDPTVQNPSDQHGYRSESFEGGVLVFDPSHVRQVALGTRSRFNDGINPVLLGDWRTQWPNLPELTGLEIGATLTRLVSDNLGNRVVWDSSAQQLLWVQPCSVTTSGTRATLNVFNI